MAKWIKLKKRVLELTEWINLDNANGVTLDTARDVFHIRMSDQEISITHKDDPEAFQRVKDHLMGTQPFV